MNAQVNSETPSKNHLFLMVGWPHDDVVARTSFGPSNQIEISSQVAFFKAKIHVGLHRKSRVVMFKK